MQIIRHFFNVFKLYSQPCSTFITKDPPRTQLPTAMRRISRGVKICRILRSSRVFVILHGTKVGQKEYWSSGRWLDWKCWNNSETRGQPRKREDPNLRSARLRGILWTNSMATLVHHYVSRCADIQHDIFHHASTQASIPVPIEWIPQSHRMTTFHSHPQQSIKRPPNPHSSAYPPAFSTHWPSPFWSNPTMSAHLQELLLTPCAHFLEMLQTMNTKLTTLTLIAAPTLCRGTNINAHTEQQYAQMRLFLLDATRHLGLASIMRDVGALKIPFMTDEQILTMDVLLTYMASLERNVASAADGLRKLLRAWTESW